MIICFWVLTFRLEKKQHKSKDDDRDDTNFYDRFYDWSKRSKGVFEGETCQFLVCIVLET